MYKFNSVAFPKPSLGSVVKNPGGKITVPDQALTIREIMERFTRGEALPIGAQTAFGDENLENPLNVDFEKLAVADLVDKQEYSDALSELKKRYDAQEERRKKAIDKKAKEKALAAQKALWEAEKTNPEKPDSKKA